MLAENAEKEGSKVETVAGKWVRRLILAVYLLILCYFLFFSELMGRTEGQGDYMYNLVPFREICRFLRHWQVIGLQMTIVNLAGNVLCFVPFGLLIPYNFRHMTHPAGMMALSCLFSVAIETVQLLFQVGCFDVDDILLNTLGGFLGVLCYWLLERKKLYFTAEKGNI